MIKRIDFNNLNVIHELYEIQKNAYQIEAELICFFDIPALKESFEEFVKCREVFLGYFEAEKLVGAVSYELEGKELIICRMVVHPDHFRKGIARRLLNYVEKTYSDFGSIVVSTGKANLPAKSLYLKNGFQFVQDREVAPGFFISCFEKRTSIRRFNS